MFHTQLHTNTDTDNHSKGKAVFLQNSSLQAHLAVVLLIIGATLPHGGNSNTQLMHLGDCIAISKSQKLYLRSVDQSLGPTYGSICGNQVLVGSRSILNTYTVVFPEKRFDIAHKSFGSIPTTSKVAIHTNGLSDLITIIGTGSLKSGFHMSHMELPYIACIWYSFVLATVAGLRSLVQQCQLKALRWI